MKVFIFMYNSSMENFHIMWKFLNELVNFLLKKKKSVFISHMISYSWFHFLKKKSSLLYICVVVQLIPFLVTLSCVHITSLSHTCINTKPGTFWKGYCPEKMASYYICTISCFHFLLTVFCGNAFVRAALHISRKLYTICNQKFRLSPLGIQ